MLPTLRFDLAINRDKPKEKKSTLFLNPTYNFPGLGGTAIEEYKDGAKRAWYKILI